MLDFDPWAQPVNPVIREARYKGNQKVADSLPLAIITVTITPPIDWTDAEYDAALLDLGPGGGQPDTLIDEISDLVRARVRSSTMTNRLSVEVGYATADK